MRIINTKCVYNMFKRGDKYDRDIFRASEYARQCEAAA